MDRYVLYNLKNKLIFFSLIFFFCCLACAICSCARPSAQVETIDNPTLLKAAQTLPQSGKLKVTNNGFVYLKVSDDFERQLFPILVTSKKLTHRTCLRPDLNVLGSHVSVFYANELNNYQLNMLPENTIFSFKIESIYKVTKLKHEYNHIIYSDWYVVQITSPKLRTLMENILPYAYEFQIPFHISLGVAKYYQDGTCVGNEMNETTRNYER